MKRKVIKSLHRYLTGVLSDREPVCLQSQGKEPFRDRGFIVGLSEKFVLIHLFDYATFALNGYQVWPLEQIAHVWRLTDYDEIIARGLRVKGLVPAAPRSVDIDDDLPTLLASIDAHYPLTVLRQHRKQPGVRLLGRVAELGDKSVKLRMIGPDARWTRARKVRYKDITRVGFGGGYEEALWLVSLQERERSGRSIENDLK